METVLKPRQFPALWMEQRRNDFHSPRTLQTRLILRSFSHGGIEPGARREQAGISFWWLRVMVREGPPAGMAAYCDIVKLLLDAKGGMEQRAVRQQTLRPRHRCSGGAMFRPAGLQAKAKSRSFSRLCLLYTVDPRAYG